MKNGGFLMSYTQAELEMGKVDAESIYNALIRFIPIFIERNKDFDINKFIDIPIDIIIKLFEENFPFISSTDFVDRLKCAIDVLGVMKITNLNGSSFMVMKHIEFQEKNICFLMNPKVMETI